MQSLRGRGHRERWCAAGRMEIAEARRALQSAHAIRYARRTVIAAKSRNPRDHEQEWFRAFVASRFRDFVFSWSHQAMNNAFPFSFNNTQSAYTPSAVRSEERRVGKECRSRWSP